MLEGIENASYSEYDLLKTYRGQKKKTKKTETKNDVKPIVDKKEKSTNIINRNSVATPPTRKQSEQFTDKKPALSRNTVSKSTNKKLTNSEKNVSKIIEEEPTRRSTRNVKPNQKYLDVPGIKNA
jgi:hypothetical protein